MTHYPTADAVAVSNTFDPARRPPSARSSHFSLDHAGPGAYKERASERRGRTGKGDSLQLPDKERDRAVSFVAGPWYPLDFAGDAPQV